MEKAAAPHPDRFFHSGSFVSGTFPQPILSTAQGQVALPLSPWELGKLVAHHVPEDKRTVDPVAYEFSFEATLENPAWEPFFQKEIVKPAYKALGIVPSFTTLDVGPAHIRLAYSPHALAPLNFEKIAPSEPSDRIIVAKMWVH